MSIFKNNLRLSGSSVQSAARLTNSRVGNRVGATFLAGLILFLFGGGAKAFTPYNALVNPGAETGSLTGWQVSNTGYIAVVSTNGAMAGVTNGIISTNQLLAHSGAYTFRLFDTTSDSAYIYQDYAAMAGSHWSASCWAICYASNYFDSAIAYMSVAFYDVSNNLLGASFDPNFSQYGFGVYGSAVLDPNGLGTIGWIIAPPQATDATGWLYLPATNFYYSYTNTAVAPGSLVEGGSEIPVSTNLTAPPGTAFVRYQLEFDNFSTDGGDVYWDDCVLEKLNQTDPDIGSPQPTSVTTYAGLPASFTVNVLLTRPIILEPVFYQWQRNGTNLPPAGGVNDISGATTNATLYFTNLQAADSGQYACWVSDRGYPAGATNTIRSVPVTLTVLVLSPLQKVNALGPNAGFEAAPVWAPWAVFNGYGFQSTNNFYDAPADTTPVNVYDGNWCAFVGKNGDRDNGLWQAVSAAPGTWWKAGGWAYISSSNDFTAGNTCRLQIWFKDAGGNGVPGTPTYESFKLYGLAYTNTDMQYTNIDTSSPNFGQVGYHAQLPRDTWVYLPVSNVLYDIYSGPTLISLHNGIGLGDDIPANTLPGSIFMVPTNTTPATAQINFQVYEYCPQTTDLDLSGATPKYLGNATDIVYWDDLELIQLVPVTNLTTSVSGNNINLSFSAGAGLVYSVLYKTNLTDAAWSELTDVQAPWSWQTNVNSIGTSYPVTVSDPLTAHSRFYRLQVH
jgi:hypothetical protein